MVNISNMRADDVFPQLEMITSGDSVRQILQRELPVFASGKYSLDFVKIERFQYKPGKSCSICYRLEVSALGNGPVNAPVLFGLLDGKGRARSMYEREISRVSFTPELVPPVHYVDEFDMVLWGFPNDPYMKHLHQLFDAKAFSAVLGRHARALGLGGDPHFPALATRVAKYVPGVRCVLEHRAWSDTERRGAPLMHLYSKTYADGRGEKIFDNMEQLWRCNGRRAGTLDMPEPLFFDQEHGAIFARPIPGSHVIDHLDELHLPSLAPRLGPLLASIHSSGLADLPPLLPDETLRNLRKADATLVVSHPEFEERLTKTVKQFEERLPDTYGMPTTPLHGAFRLSQVLICNDRLVLLDFDGLRAGNPISDVGSLCAHLLYQSVKGALTLRQSRAGIATFCAAYREFAPWGLPEPALHWFTAAELIAKHAKKMVKRGKKQRQQRIEDLLTLAENVLAAKEPVG
jgi:hypothetical protein